MTEREVVKSDYVLDPDTGLLLKRAATAINRHGAHHQAFNPNFMATFWRF